MRALETIMREYPDATARVIFAMQEQDKLEDEKEFQERNAKTLAFMADLNANGGYYRGRFGLDQHYFYRVFDLVMEEDGRVMMKVETLVMFYNPTQDRNHVSKPGEIGIERRLKDYERLDQYGLQNRERVTVKEWDEVNAYLNAMSKMFWGHIKQVES
jgi:hypothetical protein